MTNCRLWVETDLCIRRDTDMRSSDRGQHRRADTGLMYTHSPAHQHTFRHTRMLTMTADDTDVSSWYTYVNVNSKPWRSSRRLCILHDNDTLRYCCCCCWQWRTVNKVRHYDTATTDIVMSTSAHSEPRRNLQRHSFIHSFIHSFTGKV